MKLPLRATGESAWVHRVLGLKSTSSLVAQLVKHLPAMQETPV